MEFRKILGLRGPNVWAQFSVLEAWIDLRSVNDCPSSELPGFNEGLLALLPSLANRHRRHDSVRGEFVERLIGGVSLSHAIEQVALELQELAGTASPFGRSVATSEPAVYRVVIESRDEPFARACLDAAHQICLAALSGGSFHHEAEVRRLRELSQKVRLGPSTGSIVNAALRRGIPARRLNDDSLVLLGHGFKQKRINTAETSHTGAIAESIAQDKELTRELLHQVGVPVPEGRPVTDAEDAWEAAREIGGPVVVKPRFGNHGRGVTVNLRTREQVVAAYENALEKTDEVVVERFAPGDDYRLLVVGGELIAAAKREPAQVVGDGVRTIAGLVEEVNKDPRRGEHHSTSLSLIDLCPIAHATLAEQGYTTESVPAAGVTVFIRRNANLSTGGTAIDVTDRVHPEVAARVVEAAQVIGLDIAGVDVIACDISRPLEEQAGIIVEVNAGPGLRMHLEPSAGQPRPVGEAIVNTLFPPGENGRVPVVSVTGVNGKTTVTRLVAHMLRLSGKVVGMTCTDGIFIHGRRIEAGDCSGPRSAKAVLLNPKVEAAVLETARGGLLREGLGFDLCDVGIVTNVGEGDHLGLCDVHSPEDLAVVKQTVIRSVAPWGTGVLKADDPLVAGMAANCPGSVVFFARDAHDPVVAAHLGKGGKAVFVREGVLTLAEGDHETGLIPVARVAITYHGRIGFQVENVLAATAAAWSLGLTNTVISDALLTFTSDTRTTPGRFNVLHHGGATVIVDYGHNPSALMALGEAVAQFPHERRSVVFSVAGDRRDADMVRQGAIIGDLFDFVVLYEDGCTRGRPDGETVALLRQGLTQGSRVSGTFETRGEHRAIEYALRELKPGDLLIIQADKIDATLAFIQNFFDNRPTPTWGESEPVVERLETVSVAFAD